MTASMRETAAMARELAADGGLHAALTDPATGRLRCDTLRVTLARIADMLDTAADLSDESARQSAAAVTMARKAVAATATAARRARR
jgi:hypothetical protein